MISNHTTLRTFLMVACCGLAGSAAMAQTDTLEMDVTFVGSRQMEVRDAVKLSSWPIARPLSTDKPQLNYELLSKRLQFVPTMTPVEATRLRVDPSLSRLYRGYVRAGVGTRGTTLLDASFTDLRSRDGSWGTALHHAATASPSQLLTGRINDNSVDAWMSRFIGKEKVSLSGSAGRSQVLLYGFDSLAVDSALTPMDAPAVIWTHAQAQASFKSHHKDSTAFNHEAHINMGWLSSDRGASERTFKVDAQGTKNILGLHGRLDLDLQFDQYSLDTSQTSNQAIVSLEPSVSTRKGALNVRAGLGMAIDADQPTRDGLGQSFHLYPRAQVSINLLRNLFVPYAQIGGGLQANNFHTLTATNPFCAPSSLTTMVPINGVDVPYPGFRSTNKRLALSGGVRGTITQVFRFHGFFSTAQYEDFVLFRPTFDEAAGTFDSFNVVYDTVSVRTIGGEAEFDLGELWSFAGGLNIHNYGPRNEDQAWNLPNVTWNASATYKLIDGLRVVANASYIGERYSVIRTANYGETTASTDGNFTLRLPGMLDLNLSAQYNYNERLGGWVTLANLANAKYAEWGGFPVQGFQAMAGVHYAF